VLQRLIDDADETTDVLEVSRHLGRQHHVDHLLSQRPVVIPRHKTVSVSSLLLGRFAALAIDAAYCRRHVVCRSVDHNRVPAKAAEPTEMPF